MSKKNAEKKNARELQELFKASYSTCINLIRERGVEGARKQLEEWQRAGDAELTVVLEKSK